MVTLGPALTNCGWMSDSDQIFLAFEEPLEEAAQRVAGVLAPADVGEEEPAVPRRCAKKLPADSRHEAVRGPSLRCTHPQREVEVIDVNRSSSMPLMGTSRSGRPTRRVH
jgi:hypothetical protein